MATARTRRMIGAGGPGRSGAGLDLFPLVALSLLFLILIWMAFPVVSLFALVPRGYNEGWNAFVTQRAMGGDLPLYPQDQTLHVNNYPPLSFYVVGALGWFVGDNILAGRIVSLAATLAIAGEVAVVVRLLVGTGPAAGFAAMVFLGGLIGLEDRYIGYNDPQLLAHAVMLAGLIVVLSRRGGNGYLVMGAVLMVVAGLIKHSLLPLPLAVAIWLFLIDRRGLVVWLLAAGAAVGVAILALWLLYGPAVFDNIVGVRSYSLVRMMQIAKNALERLQVPLAGCLVVILARPMDAANRFVASYFGCSLLVAVVFAGGAGTGANMFFDLLIATSIGSGLLLQQAASIVPLHRFATMRTVVAAVYLLGIGLGLPAKPLLELLGASSFPTAVADTRADLTRLSGIEGPVLCEILTLCYWAGKKLEVDIFNARQGFLARGHDEQVLLDLLASGAFAAVQLTTIDPNRNDERISSAFMDSLQRHYRLAWTSTNGAFFVPSSTR